MAKRFGYSKNNVMVRDIEHSLGQGIGALHVIKVSAGRTETGLTGKRNPANLIATITVVHDAILWVLTVENFFDFRDDNRTEIHCLQHMKPITRDFAEEGDAF